MAHGRPFLFRWLEAVRKCQQISTSAQALMLALASYADIEGGSCFPTVQQLAQDCGLKRRQTKYLLREAEQLGLIAIQARFRGGRQTSNGYTLKLPSEAVVMGLVEKSEGGGSGVPGEGAVGCSDEGAVECTPRSDSKNQPSLSGSETRVRRPVEKPSRAARQLLVLWGEMLGAHKLDPNVLGGATYEQLSTAMAWTLWRHRTSKASGDHLRNLPGYYATVLASCRRGEKRLKAYCRQDMWAIATQDVTPAMFFT